MIKLPDTESMRSSEIAVRLPVAEPSPGPSPVDVSNDMFATAIIIVESRKVSSPEDLVKIKLFIID